MRAAFLFLILANVAFFVWARYLSPADPGVDPAPLGRQIEPQKLRILAPGEAPVAQPKPAAAPAAPPPVAAVASTPAVPSAPAVTPKPPTAAPTVAACMEWGSFTVFDAPKAEKALEPLALGNRVGQRRTEELASWWVFMPPQGSRPLALKKAAELRARGVEDYFIVSDEGPLRWALSLGVFRTEEAARARLAALRAQGVRTAEVGPRETTVPKVWLQVRNVDAPLEARLRDIARTVDGSELKACGS
ncbi:MAG TPA: SPOR domain-containing protein [Gemmatimonadales bacterium]|nr:SPOR domain-containing protein [Gemmatimonadales bacterium]